MKDLITKPQNNVNQNSKELIYAVVLHIAMAFLGFIASRGVILDTLMPFGIVMLGGCTAVFLPSIATGAFVGYFIPAVSGGGFR